MPLEYIVDHCGKNVWVKCDAIDFTVADDPIVRSDLDEDPIGAAPMQRGISNNKRLDVLDFHLGMLLSIGWRAML